MTRTERAQIRSNLREIDVHLRRIERNVKMHGDLMQWVIDRKDREITRLKAQLRAKRR